MLFYQAQMIPLRARPQRLLGLGDLSQIGAIGLQPVPVHVIGNMSK